MFSVEPGNPQDLPSQFFLFENWPDVWAKIVLPMHFRNGKHELQRNRNNSHPHGSRTLSYRLNLNIAQFNVKIRQK